MKPGLLFLLAAFSLPAYPQAWSTFLDPSRAIDWTSAGFTIPSYSTNCSTQPSLTTNDPTAASANATAIQNALASCDATHNVVNIPAGTYYVNGVTFGSQGNQVLRGAGGSATYFFVQSLAGCGGIGHGFCMLAGDWTYDGAANVLPPSGTSQCLWTAGYAQGTTSITLSNCGGTPPLNKTLVLDQANDTSDTGGVYMCDGSTSNCTSQGARNAQGRVISGNLYSNQQVVYTTGVTSLGGGSYTVTISPGVYLTNIRSGQSPGAWWPGFVQHDGIENMTIDMTNTPTSGSGNIGMFSCYQCWVTGTRLIEGYRNHVWLFQSMSDVIRGNYFYQSPGHAATSYTIEPQTASSFLVENNIFQQVTSPYVATGGVVGGVFAYNFAIDNIFATPGTFTWGVFASHSPGDVFDLFEGNNAYGIWADNASGPADQITLYRNMLTGFQPGTSSSTIPTNLSSLTRTFNYVGNVFGQPGYHTQYEAYASSTTTFVGAANEFTSIYDFGGGGFGDPCALNPGTSTLCDPLTRSTAMRWGNYDTVTAGTKWDSTEASPAAVTYVNANFTSSYFGSLAHTLPASLYYTSQPSWWPSGKAWPPVGPDVSSGNLGTCSGTYSGAQATSSSQCTGGTLTSAWASHANSIPAQDCYLNVMHGPPYGSGSVLSFDANLCYASGTGPASPTGLTATVR
jgi:hypothetical protein